MIRRLLISEQERQSILKSYGLLSEGVGDDYLVLPNYSVQQVISFTVAVNSSGYNNISEFKKNCINTNSIPLSKQEKKILLLNLNDKWDVLADKCMKEPKLTGVYDSNSLGGIKYTETPNKVYAEYQKNEEIKKKWTTLNPTLQKLAQDYIGYKDRKYCPNFSIEFAENRTGFGCNINNKDFGIFQNYNVVGKLRSIDAYLYGILQPNEKLTKESNEKINEFINSQSGGLVETKLFRDTFEGKISLNTFNFTNYDDIKKLYEILENLSSKSEEIKSLVVYDTDNTKKWVNFFNETDNKKYCPNFNIRPPYGSESVRNFRGVTCSFDITKKNELGKFDIIWTINPDDMDNDNAIYIWDLSYNLTEEEKNQTTKEKIAAYFVKNIPKGFERMVGFFTPFFLKSNTYKDKLDFFSNTEVTIDDIKLFYEYIIKMEQGVKNKEYLKS